MTRNENASTVSLLHLVRADTPAGRDRNRTKEELSRRRTAELASRDDHFDRHWIAITTAGMTNAIDPTTHMMAPAATWSSRAVNRKRRGTVEYDGYRTR